MSVGRTLKSTLDALSTVLVVVAAGAVIWTLVVNRGGGTTSTGPVPESVKGMRIPATAIGQVKGTASVAIVEFAEYQCPFCRQYAKGAYATVERELVTSNKARYVFMNFPLQRIHPYAQGASEAAECAGRQGHYWEMHRRLFEGGDAAIRPSGLLEQADALGLDRAAFEACIRGEASEKVAAEQAVGKELGVDGTPTFFVGIVQRDGSIDLKRRIKGATSADVLRKEVEALASKDVAWSR